MKRFTPIFQSFFKIVLIFLLCFVWTRYFVRSLISAVIISAVLTFFIDLVTRVLFSKHIEKQKMQDKEKQEASDMFFSMVLSENPMSFLSKIYKEKDDFTKHKQYLTFKEENSKILVFPFLLFKEITVNEIAQVIKIAKKENAEKIIILGESFSKECFSFAGNFTEEISLFDKFETYTHIYKKHNCFPTITKKIEEKKKFSCKELLAYSFERKRAKGYLFSALALLFCSLFVKATLYYSIVASTLLIFSLLSLSNPFSKFSKT